MVMMSYGQALQNALDIALSQDKNIFLAGEGIGTSIHMDPNLPTHGLLEKYGSRRIWDTPVSEAAIAGLAVGSSAMGLRPVVEIMFFPFITLASDMLVNHAAKLRYMSGGKSSFPLTVRVKSGVNFGAGSQHSHNLEAWIAHAPGLKLVYPSNPADAKGLLMAAIFDPNPVIFVEEMLLYWMQGDVPEGDIRVPIGKAAVTRIGTDCTAVSYGGALHTALQAAETLAGEGISMEVIDLRTLVPLDEKTVLESVRKTGRLLIIHDATKFCGYGAEIAAIAAEKAFGDLKGPVVRVAAPDIPVPVSPPQEAFYRPSVETVADAARRMMGGPK
jgi:acetoin:2,6-dichlorophenolindophenol oxidoreductase subunit beta